MTRIRDLLLRKRSHPLSYEGIIPSYSKIFRGRRMFNFAQSLAVFEYRHDELDINGTVVPSFRVYGIELLMVL